LVVVWHGGFTGLDLNVGSTTARVFSPIVGIETSVQEPPSPPRKEPGLLAKDGRGDLSIFYAGVMPESWNGY
jgi:hypothetical protein